MRKYFKLNLVVDTVMFYHGNQKDYLMKVLNHLQQLIIALLQN